MSPIKTSAINNAPRRLPVVLIADASGSMLGDFGDGTATTKIAALNKGVTALIKACSVANADVQVCVAVIVCGAEGVVRHLELTPAADIHWKQLSAGGLTPLGTAMDLAVSMITNSEVIAERDYRPIIVLSSDGKPTDDWETPLLRLNASRAGRADRFAIAVGTDADKQMLSAFVRPAVNATDSSGLLLAAGSESRLLALFNLISQTATSRSRSSKPNERLMLTAPPGTGLPMLPPPRAG